MNWCLGPESLLLPLPPSSGLQTARAAVRQQRGGGGLWVREGRSVGGLSSAEREGTPSVISAAFSIVSLAENQDIGRSWLFFPVHILIYSRGSDFSVIASQKTRGRGGLVWFDLGADRRAAAERGGCWEGSVGYHKHRTRHGNVKPTAPQFSFVCRTRMRHS